ncbi:MAG TPA: AraC family transcriptional regulator [Vicinamibacterales bacterium]
MLLRHVGFRRLCLARDMLLERTETPRPIVDIACVLGISPSHLIRQFEAVFGTTPHQFRIESRLDLAKRLLASGEYSVTDACMEVGFSSLGSFSTLFLTRVGESPSAYRRRARAVFSVPGLPPLELFPGCLTLLARLPPSAHSIFREAARLGNPAHSP